MATQEDLKNIKVFSKKLNSFIDVIPGERKLEADVSAISWMNKGWANSGFWVNEGWTNSSCWINEGWTNSDCWLNNGWNNNSWINEGWTNSSGCFLSETTSYFGLDDNCAELDTLRIFRDKLVEEDPEFRKAVLDYYETSPELVEQIYNSSNKDKILENIYSNMILPILKLLRNNKIEEAKKHYMDEYNIIKETYIKRPPSISSRQH